MRRRNAAVALATWPLLASANETAAPAAPAALASSPAPLQRWGSGDFRRFGFLVYRAVLWAGAGEAAKPPLALGLTYVRTIAGKAIAEASVDQMRRFGASDADLERWGAQMAAVFPDVVAGDQIVGIHLNDHARFFLNDKPIGDIAGRAFAHTFFAIWLDPRTSEPGLRTALLQRPG